MSQWSLTSKPNFYPADKVVATAKGWEHADTGEVLVCLRGLNSATTDAADAVGWTATVTYSGTEAMVTDDVITIVITGDETSFVTRNSYVGLGIGEATRSAIYDGVTSTDTAQKFNYTITADDVALATGVVVGTTIVGKVYDHAGRSKVLQTVTFTSPDTSTATVN